MLKDERIDDEIVLHDEIYIGGPMSRRRPIARGRRGKSRDQTRAGGVEGVWGHHGSSVTNTWTRGEEITFIMIYLILMKIK